MKTYTFEQLTDTQKQDLAEKWCDKVAHFSLENCLVEYILGQHDYENSPFTYEDITNFEAYGFVYINGYEHQLTEEERDEKLAFYEYLRDKAYYLYDNVDCIREEERLEKKYIRLSHICDKLESMDFSELPEIYQWYHCSSYACEKLAEAGQCTVNSSFWGRQCCGQSITLDCVIQKISFEYFCEYDKNYITQNTLDCHNIQF
jgi:hypothetical protein